MTFDKYEDKIPDTTINYEIQKEILDSIIKERIRQSKKYPHEHLELEPFRAVTILSEETGEVARAILNQDLSNLKDELVQVSAFCIAFLEMLNESQK